MPSELCHPILLWYVDGCSTCATSNKDRFSFSLIQYVISSSASLKHSINPAASTLSGTWTEKNLVHDWISSLESPFLQYKLRSQPVHPQSYQQQLIHKETTEVSWWQGLHEVVTLSFSYVMSEILDRIFSLVRWTKVNTMTSLKLMQCRVLLKSYVLLDYSTYQTSFSFALSVLDPSWEDSRQWKSSKLCSVTCF